MALPRCPRPDCSSHLFELKEFEPRDSRFKLMAVQCVACGTVVGVLDYMNIGAEIASVKEELGKIKKRIGA